MAKSCRICGSVKPLDGFPPRKSSRDGRRSECRECVRAFKVSWDAENKTRIREYNIRYVSKDPERVLALQKLSAKRSREKNREALRASYREWYQANRDKAAAATRAWMENNPDWRSHYREKNRERLSEKSRSWAQKNKAAILAKTRRYQLKKARAQPDWLSAIEHAQIQEMYDVALAVSVQTGVQHHVDHIHPLQGKSVCGLHVPWNLQVLPRSENIRKHNKLVDAFASTGGLNGE
jgi:hypothetical protein